MAESRIYKDLIPMFCILAQLQRAPTNTVIHVVLSIPESRKFQQLDLQDCRTGSFDDRQKYGDKATAELYATRHDGGMSIPPSMNASPTNSRPLPTAPRPPIRSFLVDGYNVQTLLLGLGVALDPLTCCRVLRLLPRGVTL